MPKVVLAKCDEAGANSVPLFSTTGRGVCSYNDSVGVDHVRASGAQSHSCGDTCPRVLHVADDASPRID
jgi:hypothetical protein